LDIFLKIFRNEYAELKVNAIHNIRKCIYIIIIYLYTNN